MQQAICISVLYNAVLYSFFFFTAGFFLLTVDLLSFGRNLSQVSFLRESSFLSSRLIIMVYSKKTKIEKKHIHSFLQVHIHCRSKLYIVPYNTIIIGPVIQCIHCITSVFRNILYTTDCRMLLLCHSIFYKLLLWEHQGLVLRTNNAWLIVCDDLQTVTIPSDFEVRPATTYDESHFSLL